MRNQTQESAFFTAGSTVVRRDVVHGKVWTAAPYRALSDQGGELLLAHWPGIQSLAPSTWTHWLRTGDDAVRKQAIPNLANGRWELEPWTWRRTLLLSWSGVDPGFGVYRFHDLENGHVTWYLNFERTPRRTRIGIDTFDLLLDLVVSPDLSGWTWKDEDEYAHARRLGLIGDAEHRGVEQARQRAVALVEARGGPLARDWSHIRVLPSWPTPRLPGDALTLAERNGSD